MKQYTYPINLGTDSLFNIDVYFDPQKTVDYLDSLYIEFQSPCAFTKKIQIKAIANACDESGFRYSKLESANNFIFNGSSNQQADYINLAGNTPNSNGAVWYSNPLPVYKGFVSDFSFRINNQTTGSIVQASNKISDGFAFVIQNTGPGSIGNIGGYLGYDGIPNSIAFEIDMFKNDKKQEINLNDPNGNHIAIQSRGKDANTAGHQIPYTLASDTTIIKLRADGTVYYVRVEYNIDPLTLSFYIDSTQNFTKPNIKLYPVFLNTLLNLSYEEFTYAGFTSGTGSISISPDILSWRFCPMFTDAVYSVAETENSISTFFNITGSGNDIRFTFDNQTDAAPVVKIYNLLGNCIYNTTVIGNQLGLNLPNGLYVYYISNGSKDYNGRFLVY